MQASTPQSTLSLPIPTLFDQPSSAVEQAKNWRATLLFNVSNNKDNPNLVNLCHHMAPKKAPKGYPRDASFMFLERFQGNDARDALMVELRVATYKNGFSLVVKRSHPKPTKYWACMLDRCLNK